MNKPVTYNSHSEETSNVAQEPAAAYMKSFSSQEEAELYRLQKNLALTDMERFQKLCRLMRIGKMLSPNNTSLSNK